MKLAIVILFANAMAAVPAEIPIDELARSLLREPLMQDVEQIPRDEGAEVIRRVRRTMSAKSFSQALGQERIKFLLLVRLGDEEATRQVLAVAKEDLASSTPRYRLDTFLSNNARAFIVPMLISDCLKNDGDIITVEPFDDGEIVKRPLSLEMCDLALSVIAHREVFSQATKDWATHVKGRINYSSPSESRATMQKWWSANEKFFRTMDYEHVGPGEIKKRPMPPVEFVLATVAESSVGGARTQNEARGEEKVLSDSSAVNAAAAETPTIVERRTSIWMWAAGLLALAAIVAFALKRRKLR